MRRILIIAGKDLIVTFRDRAAILLMLAAPFVLTLALGFITGRFGGGGAGGSGLGRIPVLVSNRDDGLLGEGLLAVLQNPELADLLQVQVVTDVTRARAEVDTDDAAALVLIPAGFSAALLPDPAAGSGAGAADTAGPVDPGATIEIYGSSARPISASVVRAVVTSFVTRVENSVLATELTVTQLVARGGLPADQIGPFAAALGQTFIRDGGLDSSIEVALAEVAVDPGAREFDLLAFFGPGMAILFLMYTVSLGGSTIRREQQAGTLSRMMVAPASTAAIIGGKMVGIFVTGAAQLGILVLSFALLLNLDWGAPLPVIALVLTTVAAATGWGTLLAAFARTPGQVMSYGTALMLAFGIMGGTFGGPQTIPDWLRPLSWLTPNYWGLTAFTDLSLGGSLGDIAGPLAALLLLALVLFLVSTTAFRRQYA